MLLNEPFDISAKELKELVKTETTRAITSKDIARIARVYQEVCAARKGGLLTRFKQVDRHGLVCNTYQELFIKDALKALLTDAKVDFTKYLTLDTAVGGNHKVNLDFKQTNKVKLLTTGDELLYLSKKYTVRELALFTYLFYSGLRNADY